MPVIDYQDRDGIALLTINRPAVRNAINSQGVQELHDAWLRFRDDPKARVAVITGAGDRAFSSGYDLKELRSDPSPANLVRQQEQHGKASGTSPFPADCEVGKPVIAAMNGVAFAAGAVLALQSDLRTATPNADIGYPVVRMGRFPPYLHEFWAYTPPAVALMSLYTGDAIPAEEAHRVGLYNRIVPHDKLLPTALEIAGKIRDNPPLVMRAIKQVWDAQFQNQLTRSTRLFYDLARTVQNSEDAVEGHRAAAEGRKPQWKGR